jgi:hypothetical protein
MKNSMADILSHLFVLRPWLPNARDLIIDRKTLTRAKKVPTATKLRKMMPRVSAENMVEFSWLWSNWYVDQSLFLFPGESSILYAACHQFAIWVHWQGVIQSPAKARNARHSHCAILENLVAKLTISPKIVPQAN